MSTSIISLWIAIVMTVGLVASLFGLSLLVGLVERYLNKPRLHFLKTSNGSYGFAFGFTWDTAKEPTKFNRIKLRLFNPWGEPTQVEVAKEFDPQTESFAMDVNLGSGYSSFMKAKNFEKGRVTIEFISDKDGITHCEEMKAEKFLGKVSKASTTVENFKLKGLFDYILPNKSPIDIPLRDFISDVVPGRGAQVAIASNPAFSEYFSASSGSDAGTASSEPVEDFVLTKVWIEEGCIVCNACEDIYPEVFEVTADSCLIRPGAPLDHGLRVLEAAEACPTEVIKFTKVS